MKKGTKALVATLVVVLLLVIVFFIFKDNIIPIINSVLEWIQNLIGIAADKQFKLDIKATDSGIFG